MRTPEPRLGIVYEHPQWFAPLFAELDRRAVSYDRIDLSEHRFDPASAAPWSIALNRLSPSAYMRGHGQTIVYGREFLRFLEWRGVDVVNDATAFAMETSKASQLLLLEELGLRAPRARIINHAREALAGAEGHEFPVVVKPNIGGSGAGIQRFDTREQLAQAAETGAIDLGIDRTALVQEFVPARGGHIVRVEVLDNRFLYAIKVYPNFDVGFNLCPADICQTDAEARNMTDGSSSSLDADLCPVDLPKVALKVEGYTPPQPVIRDVLAITRRAGIDLGGVEYLVNDRDGEIYYYDINVLSNFVSDAVSVVGFDPYVALVDYLVERGRLAQGAGERVAARAGTR
ncbi:MAG: hypothetical protein HYT96_01630 [Armatimonadetes bacterium]|nr:hypothetical protein [Armatimonadota bacterium]